MKPEIYLKSKDTTDPAYGSLPTERSVEDLLQRGMVNLDKPRGPTSHQVVAWLRDVLKVGKAGHGGTLDPKVSGVLPVALERAVRVVRYLQKMDKSYICVMTLHGDVEDDRLRDVVSRFRGRILQTPPVKSAVKREARVRLVSKIEILERDGRDVLLDITCEAGTYIRKLCWDIGEALLVGANMSELRRTRSGAFLEDNSCSLQDLVDAMYYLEHDEDETDIRRLVRPVEDFIQGMAKIWIRDTAVEALCNGASLALPGIVKCESNVEEGRKVAILTLKDELVAIGDSRLSAKQIFEKDTGLAADPETVVMARGTYPRYWKS